jgi:type II secretory pathway component PulM
MLAKVIGGQIILDQGGPGERTLAAGGEPVEVNELIVRAYKEFLQPLTDEERRAYFETQDRANAEAEVAAQQKTIEAATAALEHAQQEHDNAGITRAQFALTQAIGQHTAAQTYLEEITKAQTPAPPATPGQAPPGQPGVAISSTTTVKA